MAKKFMVSKSPYGVEFKYAIDYKMEQKRIDSFINKRKTVVVQGLGFVGSAMVAALCNAKDKNKLLYNVIGVDLPGENNYWKIAMVNSYRSPVISSDASMEAAYKNARKNGNLMATYSEYAYSKADVVIVDVSFDVKNGETGDSHEGVLGFEEYKKAISAIAGNIRENTLVIIETTVPPGTTERIVYHIFRDLFSKRGLNVNRLYLGYAFERVMPGSDYLNSIVNFYRVYSGIDGKSKAKVRKFLETFINTKKYPLFEMHSVTAAEMAKVLENSFRAMNIAFIHEWTKYAQMAGVNLFEVVDSIRKRPTHKNIMSPGFGVGGYCLTKDSLLADWSYVNLFNGKGRLRMSLEAVTTNNLMPIATFLLLKNKIKSLNGRHVTILGIAYKNGVADTRNSPAGLFYDRCLEEGATVYLHDPIVTFWQERNIEIKSDINELRAKNHDIVVFTVQHKEYLNMPVKDMFSIFKGVKLIIDANNVISDDKAGELLDRGIDVIGVGKGHWNHLAKNK